VIPPLAVIIVNYNAGAHLAACLDSIARDRRLDGAEVFVVDNDSTDGSERAAECRGPRVRLVRNRTNRGFGAAVNQAAGMTGASRLLLLNPDCEVSEGAVDLLLAALDRDPRAAVAAPQLLDEDGSTQASARGDPSAATGLFGRHSLLARVFPDAAPARRNLPARDIVASGVESAEVDWVMGACMLLRRDAFDEVHGFDEGYFLYWEDADLCRRLRMRGYRTLYIPAARVRHAGARSAESSRAARRIAMRHFHRSAYRYYATHVARSPWHPARWVARVALPIRAWWKART
jgi:N-acetylglucosaminyl-diphospho-decaprenol L-rhamnosyltransferase